MAIHIINANTSYVIFGTHDSLEQINFKFKLDNSNPAVFEIVITSGTTENNVSTSFKIHANAHQISNIEEPELLSIENFYISSSAAFFVGNEQPKVILEKFDNENWNIKILNVLYSPGQSWAANINVMKAQPNSEI